MTAPAPRARRDAVVELYRDRASRYDRATRRFDRMREDVVDALALRPRERVLDVACGTGASFERLLARVGPHGHVVGIDTSPQMLRLAAERVEANGWPNVTLVQGLVEQAVMGPPADAALFCLTHDVLQSEAALDNVFRHLRPGARVASFGAKTTARWRVPVNAYVAWKARRYVTDLEGLEAPWRHLAARLVEFEVVDRAFGGAYIAWGVCPR